MKIPNQLLTTMLAGEKILFSTNRPHYINQLILTNKRIIIYFFKNGSEDSITRIFEFTWSDLKGMSFDGDMIKFYFPMGDLDFRPLSGNEDELLKIYEIIREMRDKPYR